MRERGRIAPIGLAAIVALATACGSATHGSGPVRGPSTVASATASPGSTPSAKVPNPFTIVARYSAASFGLNHPIGLAVGPDGNLYVTDAKQRVSVISAAGKVLRRWGEEGSGPGEFSFERSTSDWPDVLKASIAVGPDGRVYVSDSGNARVEVFSPAGAFIRQFGTHGTGKGQFLVPFDLAADARGNVYVADDDASTLSKFSSSGAFEWRIGSGFSTDAQLQFHFHLGSGIDPHGRLITANETGWVVYIDAKGRKLDAFSTNGEFSFQGEALPFDVTVNSAGYTFVAGCPGCPGTPCLGHVCGMDQLVFDRSHRLVGAWYGSPLAMAPRFAPDKETFALGWDGAILKVKVALPNA